MTPLAKKFRQKLDKAIHQAARLRARKIAKEICSFLLDDHMKTTFSTEDEARFRRKIAAIIERRLW